MVQFREACVEGEDKEEKIWREREKRERGTQLGCSCNCGTTNKQKVREMQWL